MSGERIRTRGRLPHWEADRGIYFVTFRLADSVPRAVLESLKQRNQLPGGRKISRAKPLEDFLDRGGGACYLANPRIAEIVGKALNRFDQERYRLFAWCLMPNHVHVVFQPEPGHALAGILHSWKSFTAQEANLLLGRKGPFWQREYYDHLIRDGKQFVRAIRYVAENPARAGLTRWPWVYVAPKVW
jgi:REP element-mobilizing transposase RayT